MAEVTIRRTGELLRKLFEILALHPEGMPAGEILDKLASAVQLTPHEAGFYESGTRRFEKIVRFATVDCVKAGWLIKNKGVWILTEDGLIAHRQYSNPEEFAKQAAKRYREWKKSQRAVRDDSTPSDEDTAGKAASITYEQAEEQAWKEIEQYLREMNPYDFQDLVAALLKAMGYHVAWIAPPGKDGGVDIVAWVDPLGTRTPRIKVQVKRIGHSVTVNDLRSFMAVVADDEVGLFVTTSTFTKDAEDEARTQHRRKITLLDLQRLFDLWVEHYVQLDDSARRRLPLQPIYFLAPPT
jgi:restriction system protein